MANEFISRNGIIALNNSVISGSLTVTGGITGSFQGTASFSTTASNILGGASNYIPLWNGATTLSSSVLYQSSGNVGIGTTTPSDKLGIVVDTNSASGLNISNQNIGSSAKTRIALETQGGNWYIDGIRTSGEFAITRASTEIIRINSSGNVGIGTTSPTQKLEVSGNIKLTSGGYLYGDGSSAYLQLTNANGSKLAYGGSVYFEALAASINIRATSEQIDIFNNNGRIYLSGSGNVGIGTNTPVTTLQVNGTTRATRINSTGGVVDFDAQTGNNFIQVASSNMSFANNGAVNAYISSSGNVGIGTTSPSTKLHVVGQTYITDDLLIRGTHNPYASGGRGVIALNGTGGNIISFASATTTHGYMFVTNTQYEFVTVANQNFIFYNGSTEALRITNAGNVGIGTTSPSVKLDVYGNQYLGNGSTDTLLYLRGVFGSSYAWDITNKSTGLQIRSNSPNSGSGFNIDFSNNVGIGTTSPSTRLHISASTGGVLEVDGAGTAGANALYVSASGNVGIGTSTPQSKLHLSQNRNSTGLFLEMLNRTAANDYNEIGFGIDPYPTTVTAYIRSVFSNPLSSFETALTFGTHFGSTNEKMRITPPGNVGIGTTSPFSKFTVLGGASASQISIINSDGGHLILRSGIPGISNNGASFVTADVDGSNQNTRMVISATGDVGIGTASPAYRLDVSGSIGLAGSLFAQTIANYNVLYSKTGGAAIYLGGSGDPANYYDNTTHNFRNIGGGTNYATLNSTGLGIGTTSPSTAIHIARTAALSPTIRLQTTNSTANGSIQWANSANSIISVIGSNYNVSDGAGGLEFATGGTTTRMFISSSGNVGIGTTSPGAKLDIAYSTNPTTATPHIILTTGGTVKQAAITAESSAVSGLVFSTGDGTLVDRMTILRSNGNVGIGTTSPAAKLQVNGDTIISGSLNVTGSVTAPSFVGTASFAVSASWAPGGGGSSTVEEPIPAGAKLYLFYNY